MFDILLKIHSVSRWLVLIALVLCIVNGFMAMSSKKSFGAGDHKLRLFALIITHIQLLIGLYLYFSSPTVSTAFADMGSAMSNKLLRFWSVEHIFGMLAAITLITIGYSKSKRAADDAKKFKLMAVFFTIGLVLILATIPWPFMSTGRPLI